MERREQLFVPRSPVCGGVSSVADLDNPQHHEFIKAALALTDAREHAGKQYKIVRATSQVVAGSMHRLYITFDDDPSQQEYKISAWSRPWLEDAAEALKLTFEKHSGES